MRSNATQEIWFVTGSQHLYGPETLEQVATNSRKIAQSLDADTSIPVRIVWKPVVKTAEEILSTCREANNTDSCIGLVLWMHTFSPAKMWIAGLTVALRKPFLHSAYAVQRQALPYSDHRYGLHEPEPGRPRRPRVRSSSPHGMGLARKVVVGFWQDPETDLRDRRLDPRRRRAGTNRST